MMEYWVWLSSLSISPRNRIKLLNCFKDPKNIWEASKADLQELDFISEATVNRIIDKKHKDKVSGYIKSITELGLEIITIEDDKYPCYLKSIYDPPVVLYVKGTIVPDENAIAIVGSRNATFYGNEIAEEFAFRLACMGIAIVSGMARGIDSSAHKGALKARGRTIAVLGCGHDIVYPAENKKLMEEISNNGAVISEFLPGTQPIAMNFPLRNRIISGLSIGTMIVEAAEKSGSLITAEYAIEQGREVFAVPGNINSINSRGTNKLIKDGAKITTCIEDILEELNIYNINAGLAGKNNYDERKENKENRGLFDKTSIKGLSPEELQIVELLMYEPTHIDILVNKTGYSIERINTVMTMLELKGIVEQLPGKIFKIKNAFQFI